MKAHIFYNGDDVELPDETQQSNWGGYRNPDSAKMFAVCAESWRNAGWEIERIQLPQCNYWQSRLSLSSYPYNHLIPFLFGRKEFDNGIFLVTTDVINYGYYPFSFDEKRYADIPFAHFTMAAGWYSRDFLYDAWELLTRYDCSDVSCGCGDCYLKDVPEHTDESVLRHYMHDTQRWCRPSDRLRHFSRSMLKRELNRYPSILL